MTHRVRIKESENIDKYLNLPWKLKKQTKNKKQKQKTKTNKQTRKHADDGNTCLGGAPGTVQKGLERG